MRGVGTPTPRGGIPVARSLGDEPSVSGIRRSGANPTLTSQGSHTSAQRGAETKEDRTLPTARWTRTICRNHRRHDGDGAQFVQAHAGCAARRAAASDPQIAGRGDVRQPAERAPAREASDEPTKELEKPKVAGKQGGSTSATPVAPRDHKDPPARSEPEPKQTAKQSDPVPTRPVAQGNPFRELPKAVELPPLGPGDTESQIVTLGKVPVQAGGDYTVELLGGNIAVAKSAGQFRLRRQDVDAQNTDWLIAFDAATESTGSSSSPVAAVRRRQDDLQFRWAAGAGKVSADQLRNCILHLRSGSSSSMLRLRKPAEVPALPVDLSKEKSVTTIPCEFLPDPESLFVEVLDLEARGVAIDVRPVRFAVRSVAARESAAGEPTTIYIGDAKGDSSSKPLALRLSCVVRGLGSIRLEMAPMYRVNDAWAPLNTGKLAGTLSELNSKADSLKRRVEKLDADRYKKEFADAKKQLEDAEAAIAELEKLRAVYVKVNDVGRLHYRLIHRVGDQEVLLTTTHAADAN